MRSVSLKSSTKMREAEIKGLHIVQQNTQSAAKKESPAYGGAGDQYSHASMMVRTRGRIGRLFRAEPHLGIVVDPMRAGSGGQVAAKLPAKQPEFIAMPQSAETQD